MIDASWAVTVEPFDFTFDDLTIRGSHWGSGPNWVLLLHAPGEDLDVWADLPAVMAASGYSVLATDLPGHGLSDDPWDAARAPEFVRLLATLARAEGARRVFAVACGESATAAPEAQTLDALVALSPRPPARPNRGSTAPALILVGGLDGDATEAADRFFRDTRGWAVSSSLGTADQGAALYRSTWGQHALEQTLAFLRDYRWHEP